MRLDRIVSEKFGVSRRRARELVESGRVDVAGKTRDEPGLEVAAGDGVTLDINRPAVRRVRTRLSVLHEDRDLIVVDKPAGLLTLPTAAREKDTLLGRVNSYLLYRYGRRPYVGVVHRLDKDTSGSVVFARDRDTLRGLQELFRRHDVDRVYLALLEGVPRADSGTVDRELVADRGDRRRGVSREAGRGRRSVTHYKVVERFLDSALAELRLETGRTHQIRVHMASIGHPVIGDTVYRPRHFREPAPAAPRQMLHAARLAFRHPSTGANVACVSAPPDDFLQALAEARRAPKKTTPRPGRGVRSETKTRR